MPSNTATSNLSTKNRAAARLHDTARRKVQRQPTSLLMGGSNMWSVRSARPKSFVLAQFRRRPHVPSQTQTRSSCTKRVQPNESQLPCCSGNVSTTPPSQNQPCFSRSATHALRAPPGGRDRRSWLQAASPSCWCSTRRESHATNATALLLFSGDVQDNSSCRGNRNDSL